MVCDCVCVRVCACCKQGMKEAVLIMLEQGEQDLFEEVIQTAKTDPSVCVCVCVCVCVLYVCVCLCVCVGEGDVMYILLLVQ